MGELYPVMDKQVLHINILFCQVPTPTLPMAMGRETALAVGRGLQIMSIYKYSLSIIHDNRWMDEKTVGNVLLMDSFFGGVQAFGLLRRMPCILHMRQKNRRFFKVSEADQPTTPAQGISSPVNPECSRHKELVGEALWLA